MRKTLVAGDGNRDMVWAIEALSKETESKQAAPPTSQAPCPDPTTRPGLARAEFRSSFGCAGSLVQSETLQTHLAGDARAIGQHSAAQEMKIYGTT